MEVSAPPPEGWLEDAGDTLVKAHVCLIPGGLDCSISFVSHVLGKVCVHGRQSECFTVLFWGWGKCFSVLAWEDGHDDDQRKEWETNELIWSCSEWGCTGCPLLSEAA